jgi:hypothetical protein
MKLLLFIAFIASGLAISSTFADDAPSAPPAQKAPAAQKAAPAASQAPTFNKGERSKSLSFDDSVVEGLNQNNKDSLEMVEKRDGRNRQHLYQKRADFKPEIKQFPSEMGYSP